MSKELWFLSMITAILIGVGVVHTFMVAPGVYFAIITLHQIAREHKEG